MISGITGQDGSYLAELLLQKGYKVFGLIRRSSTFNTARIDHLIEHIDTSRFDWMRADLTDGSNLARIVRLVKPDEIYNLAAQSHVMVSFEVPEYTLDTIVMGTIRLLEAVRDSGLHPKIYQACSSEMYGATPPPHNEASPLRPRSPYAAGKACAYYLGVNYREAYGMWIANGILFNHESPRRGETFVTRKVSRAVARIKLGLQQKVQLGNLDAKRDWGYAPEYAEAMWLMLQQDEPNDYVIGTGESHSVREFVELAFRHAGIELEWRGRGINEQGIATAVDSTVPGVEEGGVVVEVEARYFRPTDVELLVADATKAGRELGWRPITTFPQLVKLMVDADLERERLLLEGTAAHGKRWMTHI